MYDGLQRSIIPEECTDVETTGKGNGTNVETVRGIVRRDSRENSKYFSVERQR